MSPKNKTGSPKTSDHKKREDANIDHLLKQTLKDDLPVDAEAVMKNQLEGFRLKLEEASGRTWAGQKTFQAILNLMDVRWARILVKKEVVLVISLMMIVLGSFIHSSGSPNQLTENLSVLGTSVVVSNEMIRSQSMECSIQMYGDNQEPLHYAIQWLSPNLSKVHVEDSRNAPLKTIWISEEDIVIDDHITDRRFEKKISTQLDDPILKPIVGYLEPEELVERMYGEWKLLKYQKQKECAQGIFAIALSDERATLEVTLDLCTHLPVSIKKILHGEEFGEERVIFNVRYTWNIPISPQSLAPTQILENPKG